MKGPDPGVGPDPTHGEKTIIVTLTDLHMSEFVHWGMMVTKISKRLHPTRKDPDLQVKKKERMKLQVKVGRKNQRQTEEEKLGSVLGQGLDPGKDIFLEIKRISLGFLQEEETEIWMTAGEMLGERIDSE